VCVVDARSVAAVVVVLCRLILLCHRTSGQAGPSQSGLSAVKQTQTYVSSRPVLVGSPGSKGVCTKHGKASIGRPPPSQPLVLEYYSKNVLKCTVKSYSFYTLRFIHTAFSTPAFGAAFSSSVYSTHAFWSRIFQSRIFRPSILVPHFPVLYIPPLHLVSHNDDTQLVTQKIAKKVSFVHTALQSSCPPYLADLLQLHTTPKSTVHAFIFLSAAFRSTS